MLAVGPFDLIALAGRGGMGEIWRGEDRVRRVPAAIKLLPIERTGSSFRNEVRMAAALDHPNIILVFDYGELPEDVGSPSGRRLRAGSPWLATEWASGGTLAARLPLRSWSELEDVLLHVLAALAHAHATGILHRDVKPSNVVVCGEHDTRPGLKLADFGISRSIDQLAEPLVVVGTPSYMAPEQILGLARDEGPWTDLYAVGCLAFALATGKPPFAGPDRDEVLNGHLRGSIPRLRPVFGVADGFEDWIRTLLEKDPVHRFSVAADARQALLEMEQPTPAADLSTAASGAYPVDDDTLDVEPAVASALEQRIGDGAARRPPGARASPPISWRAGDSHEPDARTGVGLGLFGLRAIPLVGRERERDRLWDAFRRVHDDRAVRGLVMQGPAGCGKSRLADWLCVRAHELGVAMPLRAMHSPLGGPRDGLVAMLGRHFRAHGLSRAALLTHVEAQLRLRGATDPREWAALTELIIPASGGGRDAASSPPVRFGGPSERYEAMAQVFERICVDRPIVLWIDDVQWAADALGFAAHVLSRRARARMPMLMLLTAREDALVERDEESALLARISAHPSVERVAVEPLEEQHRSALVRELLGLEDDLAVQVEQRTAGTPLFAVQLVGDWVQRGILEPSRRGFRLRPGARVDLPDDLHAVWASRVARMLEGRPSCDSVALELAAALGQHVDAAEWREACRRAGVQPSADLVDALLEARLARVNGRDAGEGWSFVHGMLSESLGRLAQQAGRWESHHRTCAAVVEDQSGPGVAERLGLHLFAAGCLSEALEPLLVAAHERVAAGEYRSAEALLVQRARALTTLAVPEQDERWARGWLAQGTCARLRGKLDEALGLLQRAEDLAVACGYDDTLVHTLDQAGKTLMFRLETARALELFRRAIALAERLGARAELVHTKISVANLHWQRAAFVEGEALARGALDEAEVLGEPLLVARALDSLCRVLVSRGTLDEAVSTNERASTIYEESGARWGVEHCFNQRGDILRMKGRLDEAEACYRDATMLSRSIGSSHVAAELNLAVVSVQRGAFGEARTRFQELMSLAGGRRDLLRGVHMGLLVCAAAQRDWAAWDREHHDMAQSVADAAHADVDVALLARMAGDLARDAEDVERARQGYALALAQWRALGRDDEVAAVEAALDALHAW